MRSTPPYRRAPRGLTLIELLIVLAIVAVLAAVLFPVVARARVGASMPLSLSSASRIETESGIYSQDYDEQLPLNPEPHYMAPVGYRSLYALGHLKRRPSCWRTSNVTYHGGEVEEAPRIYVIFWGSQWNNNDPSGEAAILQSFYSGVGGSSWNAVLTQYCDGAAIGSTLCTPGAAGPVGNPASMLAGVWFDNASAAPSSPTQSDTASEAVRAAQHFGNTAAGSNDDAQYVVATATGNNSSGFVSHYCAYHSSTSSSYGSIAYTNLPYITDGGAPCGANFNGLGPNAGITIVAGHEVAESETDPFQGTAGNPGWFDRRGDEVGDKCVWIKSGQGAATNVVLSTGTFPVQSLWSNALNSNAGGCALSYP